METAKTILKDREGKEHEYMLDCFSSSDGITLGLRVWDICSGVLGEALGAIIDIVRAPGFDFEQLSLDGEVMDLVRSVLDVLPKDTPRKIIPLFVHQLRQHDASLMHTLLALCARDGKALKDRLEFDTAYSGNYSELAQALVWVVRTNGFFDFFPSGAESSAKQSITSLLKS